MGATLPRLPCDWIACLHFVLIVCSPSPHPTPHAHRLPGLSTPSAVGASAGASAAAGTDRATFSKSLRIYEAHVGMASQELKVGSYREFARDVLPRVKELGYTCVQVRRARMHAVVCIGMCGCMYACMHA